MIARLPHPVITRTSRARPAIVDPRATVDPGRRLAPHPPDPPTPRLPSPRIADRVVFDKLIQVLVFGCGYRRIADATCSATTLRRRRDEWIALGPRRVLGRAREGGLIVAIPEGLTFEEAAPRQRGLVLRRSLIRAAKVRRGQDVLVYGATGELARRRSSS
jgi:hypothetical protein